MDVYRFAIPHLKAARVVHPGVNGDHERRSRHPREHDRQATEQVGARRQPIPPVHVDADEDRLEEERKPLERETEAEHAAERADEVRPENAELEAEDRTGHDSNREQRDHHLRPAPRDHPVAGIARAQIAPLGEYHH